MKVIILKSCLALLPSFEGCGQLDLSAESRADAVTAITSPSQADIVLAGSDLAIDDFLLASHNLVVDDYIIRDVFGRDWPVQGDFLTLVELKKFSNYEAVELTNVAGQNELERVRRAMLRIRFMTMCALFAGDDFNTALLNGAHCWARRTLYLGKVLQTAEYNPSTDIDWQLVSLLPENAPSFVAEAAREIDKGTASGFRNYISGKVVQFADKSKIEVKGTQQLQDICKAAVMAGMLGDERWVNMNVAAASVMLMYRRGLDTAKVSKSLSADVLDCLDEEGEGEIGAALTQLWAFDSGIPTEHITREPHWAGRYKPLKGTKRRKGVKIREGTGIEMILGAPDEISTSNRGRERLFIQNGELRKKRGNGIIQGIVAAINHAPKLSVLGSGVELRPVRATDTASGTTLLNMALSGSFGPEAGVWALSKVFTGCIRIARHTNGLKNASYAVGVEQDGGTVALAFVDQDIMSNIAVYDDGEDVLLHVLNSQIYFKLTNESNGTMSGELVHKKIKVLTSGVLAKPKKLG